MSDPADLPASPSPAEARATAARARLAATLSKLQSRLSPRELARDAALNLAERGRDSVEEALKTARNHPVKTLGIATALGLFLARRPLLRLFTRTRHATLAAPTSLKP